MIKSRNNDDSNILLGVVSGAGISTSKMNTDEPPQTVGITRNSKVLKTTNWRYYQMQKIFMRI